MKATLGAGVFAVASATVIAVLIAAHLFVGRSEIPAGDVWRVLNGTGENPAYDIIVLKFRLPRVLIGLGAGALLAVAGVLVQSLIRNPLAEPGTTGIGSGAALAVVVSLVVLPERDIAYAASWVGAFLTGSLLFLVGRRSLAVTGVLLGAVLSAVTSLLLVVDSAPIGVVLRWLVGSLNGRTLDDWSRLWPWLVILPVLSWILSVQMNVWALGQSTGTVLGVRPVLLPIAVLTVAVSAAAAAIAAAGAVAFVGLVAPHVGRLIVGSDHRSLIPVSAVLGAALLCGADLIAFSVSLQLPGVDTDVSGVPVGAITALVGAPVLVALIRREAHA